MGKELETLDSTYLRKVCKLSVAERIDYCENLIDKVQLSLIRNKKLLSKTMQAQLSDIIDSARMEIKTLKKISV